MKGTRRKRLESMKGSRGKRNGCNKELWRKLRGMMRGGGGAWLVVFGNVVYSTYVYI